MTSIKQRIQRRRRRRLPIVVIQSKSTEGNRNIKVNHNHELLSTSTRAYKIRHTKVKPRIELRSIRRHKRSRRTSCSRKILRTLKHSTRIELPNRTELSTAIVGRGEIRAHPTELERRNRHRSIAPESNTITVKGRSKLVSSDSRLRRSA